jgi:hypothetical protein
MLSTILVAVTTRWEYAEIWAGVGIRVGDLPNTMSWTGPDGETRKIEKPMAVAMFLSQWGALGWELVSASCPGAYLVYTLRHALD